MFVAEVDGFKGHEGEEGGCGVEVVDFVFFEGGGDEGGGLVGGAAVWGAGEAGE